MVRRGGHGGAVDHLHGVASRRTRLEPGHAGIFALGPPGGAAAVEALCFLEATTLHAAHAGRITRLGIGFDSTHRDEAGDEEDKRELSDDLHEISFRAQI